MDKKTKDLLNEELDALDVPVGARINTVQLPPQTPQAVEDDARALFVQYAHLLPTIEDAEYFSMLPLSASDRSKILTRATELDIEARKLKVAWIQEVSTK